MFMISPIRKELIKERVRKIKYQIFCQCEQLIIL